MENFLEIPLPQSVREICSPCLRALTIALLTVALGHLQGQDERSAIFADGAKLEKLGGGYVFTEGPACDTHGNVYFSDQP